MSIGRWLLVMRAIMNELSDFDLIEPYLGYILCGLGPPVPPTPRNTLRHRTLITSIVTWSCPRRPSSRHTSLSLSQQQQQQQQQQQRLRVVIGRHNQIHILI